MVQEFGRAKINLTLDILGKRDDGYHEVELIMQTIELADVIELERIPSGITIEVSGNDEVPADANNLAYRAVVAVNKFCGTNFGVAIHLQKKIPMAAGLAGGSADAAATIRAMNRLYDLKLSTDELCKIGERVGSDVPFCIIGGTCLATGRGEKLTRLRALKQFSVVLVKPRGEILTSWAYKTYDLQPTTWHPPAVEVVNLLNSGAYDKAFPKFFNVLESVAGKKFPEIGICKDKFIRAKAKVALMSGSGPTVFALTDAETAANLAESVEDVDAQVIVTKIFNEDD